VRVAVQRVDRASVEVDGRIVGAIDHGFVVFVGVGQEDLAGGAPNADARAAAMAEKVANLRILADAEGKANLSLLDTGGAALVISQFTLYADCRRGRRPSFSDAADPDPAEALVEEFRVSLERLGVPTAAGRFGAHMTVSLVNDGPYTIILDSEVLSGPRRGGQSAPQPIGKAGD
jgi:D-aminoacyl-tRNA deacylase